MPPLIFKHLKRLTTKKSKYSASEHVTTLNLDPNHHFEQEIILPILQFRKLKLSKIKQRTPAGNI